MLEIALKRYHFAKEWLIQPINGLTDPLHLEDKRIAVDASIFQVTEVFIPWQLRFCSIDAFVNVVLPSVANGVKVVNIKFLVEKLAIAYIEVFSELFQVGNAT